MEARPTHLRHRDEQAQQRTMRRESMLHEQLLLGATHGWHRPGRPVPWRQPSGRRAALRDAAEFVSRTVLKHAGRDAVGDARGDGHQPPPRFISVEAGRCELEARRLSATQKCR